MEAWTFEKKLRNLVKAGFMRAKVTEHTPEGDPLEIEFTVLKSKECRLVSKGSRQHDFVLQEGCKIVLNSYDNPVGFWFENAALPTNHPQRIFDTTFRSVSHVERCQ